MPGQGPGPSSAERIKSGRGSCQLCVCRNLDTQGSRGVVEPKCFACIGGVHWIGWWRNSGLRQRDYQSVNRLGRGVTLYQYRYQSSQAAMIFVALFFFLSPRRRSGERTEERGGPSSPQPSPPSDGGEGVFGCSSAALYQYLWKLF